MSSPSAGWTSIMDHLTLTGLAGRLTVPSVVSAHPVLAVVAGTVAALFLLYLYRYPYKELTLSFNNLPGPAPSSLLWGNLKEIIDAPPAGMHLKWAAQYGNTVRYRVLGGGQRVATADVGAINYILGHSYDFIKPEATNKVLVDMLGDGVLTAEGDMHKRQRRVLNPAFSISAITGMTPIVYDKAYELERKLQGFVSEEPGEGEETCRVPATGVDIVKGSRKIDVSKYLGQMTLDVIGIAGFNYDFQSLSHEHNELADAFSKMFSAGQNSPLNVAAAFFPPLRVIPSQARRTVAECRAVTVRIGRKLVDEKKAALGDSVEKDSDIGKDLLSRLMKANMASDLRADQKLSDDEVLAQITTFMLAGNETSSTALTWILYRLALHPKVQDRLRAELLSVDEDQPSLDTLNALPFLDNVVHESLRLDSPVPGTIRVATKTHAVPLSTPVRGRDGKMMDHFVCAKGTNVFLPIRVVHYDKEIWGPDADQFNPDRFDKEGIPGKSVPGVYGNVLTFLGGARNCIGYRLALAEIKITLFVLLRTLAFDRLPSNPEIEQTSRIVMRPRVIGEESAGLQMPLLVRAVDE